MAVTMLTTSELKRRIDAARTLRGLTQEELGQRFADEGFGRHDVGRIERGRMPLMGARRRTLALVLDVPESWFTDDYLDLAGTAPWPRTQIDRLEAKLDRLLAVLGVTEQDSGPIVQWLADQAAEADAEALERELQEGVQQDDMQAGSSGADGDDADDGDQQAGGRR